MPDEGPRPLEVHLLGTVPYRDALSIQEGLVRQRRAWLMERKAELEKGPFLEKRIRQFFLDNPHRLLFTLEPDADLESRQVAATRAELKSILATLEPGDIQRLNKDAKALEALQETEEDLSILPTLEREDIPPEIEIIHPDDP